MHYQKTRRNPYAATIGKLGQPDATGLALLTLKDKGRGVVYLFVRNGEVTGAIGSEPKRYIGLPVDTARYLAKFGAPPKRYLSKPGAASRHERPRKH